MKTNKLLIKARDVVNMSIQEIQSLQSPVNVVYDDGDTKPSSINKLIYSWFFWKFHRVYPTLPLLFDYHIDGVLNGQSQSSSTHIELLNRITRDLVLKHGFHSHEAKESIQSLIYEVTNDLNNELPKLTGKYVMTLDILDILELSNSPKILELKSKVQPNANAIEDFYAQANKIITTSPEFKNNNLVKFMQMKILNQNQINQCILARGFPIEVTGTILSKPIMSCYASGLNTVYDYISESRSASKAMFTSEAPLQQAEYFARRLQLTGMVVQGISEFDCGTTEYLEWFVKPPTYTSTNRMIYSGDLKFLKGKMYLDEVTGALKDISGKETHLFGKYIKLRSVLYCKESNPHKVCPTCFGMLHHNVSRFANLGHLCDANLTQQSTQILLSTKHHIGSAVGSEILLKEDGRRYFDFQYQTMSFHLKPMNKTSKYKLFVSRNAAMGLTDLKLLPSIEKIKMHRISTIDTVTIQETKDNGAVINIPVKIEQNKRFGYFSGEFLKYLKETSWSTNEYDMFVFDMTNWNTNQPLIRVPDMEYSYSNHVDQIAGLIESKDKKHNGRIKPDTPAQTLQDLFDLVNSKINVNIALLEVMIYAVTTPDVDDFGLARNVPKPIINIARNIIGNRSLGPAYAYEGQAETISDPRSFMQQNRPSSPVDVFLCPNEVVAEMKKQGPGQNPYHVSP